MPITRLRHADAPYTMLPVDTVQAIADPTALAIWCYLQSQPEDWIVHQSQLCEHFGIGRKRYQNAVRALKDLGLYTVSCVKDAEGRVKEWVITIQYQKGAVSQLGNPEGQKSTLWAAHPVEKEPLQSKKSLTNKKKKKISTSTKPDFISSAVWDRWFAYRCERRLPMTNTASRMLVAKLEKARAAGATPAELESEIDAAIERGWRTIYPAALKEKPKRERTWL
jgi:hypothetical protein